ncbi:MAG: class I SAM-dependent methyltransferase [Clostridia bacterium]|nr:class I SAM-dependent methyltransferase [Clostridia bacterium]
MRIADDWKDYKIIATSDGMKLENWKGVILLRPDPQVIWSGKDLYSFGGINAVYHRSEKGGGAWEKRASFPAEWTVSYRDLTFKIKPMGFKHTGLFPEQAVNWNELKRLICGGLSQNSGKEIKVLNLFAYTGAASVACAKAGAKVTHVDAAKGMVERAGENARLSGVESGIRYIVDDCMKFVAREIRRGNKYDGIIMDPPSYGRGPGGEMWKIERDLFGFVKACAQILSDKPLFFLINSYTTGLQPAVLKNILTLALKDFKGSTEAYEVGIATEEGIPLPCGASGLFTGEGYGQE